MYLATLLHEIAHLIMCVYLKEKPKEICLGIFGAVLKTEYVENSKNKFLISLAGPLMSLIVFIYMCAFGFLFSINNFSYRFFAICNFSVGSINLLPLSPLDGGAMLKAFFIRHSGIIGGSKIYMMLSSVFCFAFFICNFYLIASGLFNPSLFMFLIFSLWGIRFEKLCSLREKNTVLSGRFKPKKKLKFIFCDWESELMGLAKHIGGDYTLLIAAFSGERFYGELNQFEITDGIQKYGALCTVKDYIEKRGRI